MKNIMKKIDKDIILDIKVASLVFIPLTIMIACIYISNLVNSAPFLP